MRHAAPGRVDIICPDHFLRMACQWKGLGYAPIAALLEATHLRRTWDRSFRQTSQRATKDALILGIVGIAAWVLIERTDTCTRFFQYVSANPDMELDSIILAGIFSAVGLLVFALRRWSEAARSERRSDRLARHDALTGLPNRRSFMATLEEATGRGTTAPFACFLFDRDNFKEVNDLRGHIVGDQLLVTISKRIVEALPPDVQLARIGGDEFAMLSPLTNPDRMMELANLIMRLVCEPAVLEGQITQVGVSIGVARYPEDAQHTSSLLRKADIALYRAKVRKRSVQIFEPDMETADRRLARVVAALRDAIPKGEIVPHYQPLVDLATGEIIGVEVLARWESPTLGTVPPSEFIPVASHSGMIGKLCCSVFERACAEAVRWKRPLRISFNLAPRQLCDPHLPLQILAHLAKTGLDPARLDIEMTEDALLENDRTALANLEKLKDQGITLTLDDFGTGYSSLHHLRILPFDRLKIDRSYVNTIARCEKSRLMIEAIIGLCHALALPVLAEGVETREQERILRELGCDLAQGWLYSKAMPNTEFESFLAETQKPEYSALRA